MKHESIGWSSKALVVLLLAGISVAAIDAGMVRQGTADVPAVALARAAVPADTKPATPGPTDPSGPPG